MKQIYNFEASGPPHLNERKLRTELERRRLNLQTALIALSGILMQAVLVLLAFILRGVYPLLTAMCLGYMVISVTSGSILAILFAQKGGVIHDV